jgi:phosphocarrier protein
MPETKVTVTNTLGLHARAAARLVRVAGKFRCRIKLKRCDNDVVADAKSILSVLTLAAAVGSELDLSADGADADSAMEEIVTLFQSGFEEK